MLRCINLRASIVFFKNYSVGMPPDRLISLATLYGFKCPTTHRELQPPLTAHTELFATYSFQLILVTYLKVYATVCSYVASDASKQEMRFNGDQHKKTGLMCT